MRGENRGTGVERCVEETSEQRTAAALALLDRSGRSFMRTARRLSICPADAEDAFQRASLILLTRAPAHPLPRLAAWMHVVTRHEALRVRRDRERSLAPAPPTDRRRDPLELVAATSPSPAEHAERRDEARARARALERLKPDQRRALVLKAEGYSYAEIGELTGWSYTKVNRCLAEGRARLRQLGG